jgi:hypothetical protein
MDLELADWRADWIAENLPDAALLRVDLRLLVERGSRRMRFAFAGQLLCAAAILVFTAWFASRNPTLEWILWAAVLWVSTFLGIGLAIRTRTGTWKALGQSNAAFLDLSLRRCRRELRAIHHGRWSLAAALSIVMGWLSLDAFLHRLPVGPYLLGVTINVLIAAVWLAIFTTRERRANREFEQLSQFAYPIPE